MKIKLLLGLYFISQSLLVNAGELAYITNEKDDNISVIDLEQQKVIKEIPVGQRPRGIIFNHEGSGHSHLFKEGKNDDEYYTRNNFKEFRKRYSNRILNFKNYCKKSNEITFFYNHKDFDESIIKNIIINTYGKKTIKFISLN